MNELNFEKYRDKEHLENYFLRPVGRFTKEELQLIYQNRRNIRSIPYLAKMMGFRTTMEIELMSLKHDTEWRAKVHSITDEEAVEIFFRAYLLDSLIKWCKENE